MLSSDYRGLEQIWGARQSKRGGDNTELSIRLREKVLYTVSFIHLTNIYQEPMLYFCKTVGTKVDTQIFIRQSLARRSSQLTEVKALFVGNYAECVKCQRAGTHRKRF